MENGDTLMEQEDRFKFGGPDTPAHRFTLRLVGPIPIQHSGVLLVESRVRKVGAASWKHHSYRVVVEMQKVEEAKKEAKKEAK
jgi:hypothetical protein